ncbi:MAG: winged helix-turn-helix domain-containing protein [Candidatus Anstonellales archaeon]
MEKKEKDIYNTFHSQGDRSLSSGGEIEHERLEREVEEAKNIARDPFLLSSLMLRILREKEEMKTLLREILEKLEDIEKKLSYEEEGELVEPLLLSKQDEEIVDLIIEKGAVCALDIQKRLNYKGKNAACARLSRLADAGILVKRQVGKTVYYQLSQAAKSRTNFGGSGPMV